MIPVSTEELSEEEFETIVSSRGFQKMLLYRRLADGIEVVRTHDRLYESMVEAITDQHSEIDSVQTVQEVLSLLEEEVRTYTEPLTPSDTDDPQLPEDLVSSHDDESLTGEGTREADPQATIRGFLEDRLAECDELEMKANEIASALGLRSTHVGGILGRWRHADDPPFAITAAESPGGGNVWTIRKVE